MSESVNYGINAGSVSAHNLAVGPNARIDVAANATGLSEQFAALLRAIEAFDGDREARAELAAAADEVAEALEQPAPHKERVLSRLAKIASAAGSAGAIASAATAMADAARAIL
ncbi:MAG: hypothetical protein QOI98_3388 [Solirubrobacteraceae bacterium]|jgi:hypothetical protein|nr:hypothetical protein [Solirubrobacteraceae bacterium]